MSDYLVRVAITGIVEHIAPGCWATSITFTKSVIVEQEQRDGIIRLCDMLRHMKESVYHTAVATLTNADGFLFEFACADPAVITDWFRQAGIDWPGGEFPCIAVTPPCRSASDDTDAAEKFFLSA